MSKINYVNTVIFDQDCSRLVYLRKITGPKFLINKYNFIGGKVDEGETNGQAATREIQEEAFIKINTEDLISIGFEEGEDWSLETFTIQVNDETFIKAKQTGIEPVFICNTQDIFIDSERNPELFSNDFIYFLELALNKFNF